MIARHGIFRPFEDGLDTGHCVRAVLHFKGVLRDGSFVAKCREVAI